MATKVRKQIYIEPQQEAMLKRLGREQGLSEAELIRRAIDQFVRGGRLPWRDLAAWEEERAFITRLMEEGAVSGQRTWQREELHAR